MKDPIVFLIFSWYGTALTVAVTDVKMDSYLSQVQNRI